MEDIESLKKEIRELQDRKVRIQTLKDQAIKICKEIEAKYNITSSTELEKLVVEEELRYNNLLKEAREYISATKQELSRYEALL